MPISALLQNAAFVRTRDALDADFERFVKDIVTLTEIPAAPFQEMVRAEAFRDMLTETGIGEVSLDAIGNVVGCRHGQSDGGHERQTICIAAHLDTVFPPGTDTKVRREGNRLYAPGVGDDTRGLAVLLALARAIAATGLKTRHDILFVGNVGEEGPGNLRGIRHLFQEGAWAGKIDAFFSVDGADMETVIAGGIGSHRYRVVLAGPGGHSFIDFGIVNPANALGDFLAGLARVPAPKEPRTTYCASMVGGGTSINAIPQQVWVDVDLRSADPRSLENLDRAMRGLVENAVTSENTRGNTARGAVSAELTQIGDRPAAPLATSGRVVDEAVAALAAHGFTARLERGSTDANIPLSLGIPAVALGSGVAGGNLHTLAEWIDVEPEPNRRALAAILAALLAVAEVVH
jgi:acetylornithine deacetylase/succinyl-diaminopimelate desuccinylase-like protein